MVRNEWHCRSSCGWFFAAVCTLLPRLTVMFKAVRIADCEMRSCAFARAEHSLVLYGESYTLLKPVIFPTTCYWNDSCYFRVIVPNYSWPDSRQRDASFPETRLRTVPGPSGGRKGRSLHYPALREAPRTGGASAALRQCSLSRTSCPVTPKPMRDLHLLDIISGGKS